MADSPRSGPTLTDLPFELFMHITSLIDARAVLALSQVCRRFHAWLQDELYWKARLMRRWPLQFPALADETVDWREACCQREELHRYWSDWASNVDKVEVRVGLSQCVDALHIKANSNLLLVGGRDRYLSIFDTERLRAQPDSGARRSALVFEESRTHKGWIWCIKARDQRVVTTAWDEKLRFWTLDGPGLTMEREIPLKSAVLCTTFLDSTDVVAASTYGKSLFLLDRRLPEAKVMTVQAHRRAVLRVCAVHNPQHLISASEDRSVCLWDLRNGAAPLFSYKFAANFGYPRCLSHHMRSQLWVGDSRGLLHLLRVSGDRLSLEHSYELSCVLHLIEVHVRGQGLLATASQRELVRIWHPTQPPLEVCSLQVNSSNQDLACMDFTEHAFAVGAGNGVVTYCAQKRDET